MSIWLGASLAGKDHQHQEGFLSRAREIPRKLETYKHRKYDDSLVYSTLVVWQVAIIVEYCKVTEGDLGNIACKRRLELMSPRAEIAVRKRKMSRN